MELRLNKVNTFYTNKKISGKEVNVCSQLASIPVYHGNALMRRQGTFRNENNIPPVL